MALDKTFWSIRQAFRNSFCYQKNDFVYKKLLNFITSQNKIELITSSKCLLHEVPFVKCVKVVVFLFFRESSFLRTVD